MSPISERNISENAAKKPDLPIAEWAAQSCRAAADLMHANPLSRHGIVGLYATCHSMRKYRNVHLDERCIAQVLQNCPASSGQYQNRRTPGQAFEERSARCQHHESGEIMSCSPLLEKLRCALYTRSAWVAMQRGRACHREVERLLQCRQRLPERASAGTSTALHKNVQCCALFSPHPQRDLESFLHARPQTSMLAKAYAIDRHSTVDVAPRAWAHGVLSWCFLSRAKTRN